MKLCIVGHFKRNFDEGATNVGKYIANELEYNGIQVRKINILDIFSMRNIKAFNPDIIHYILSPTIIGFISVKLLSFVQPRAKVLISAIHPAILDWKFLSLFRPDLVLVQSYKSEKVFRSIGCRIAFLPNGVDTTRFQAVDATTKRKLREKYDVPQDKFIILHLASLKKQRNLGVFIKLQKQEDNKLIIIGRENEDSDKQVVNELQEAGCTVWIKHFPNIEEIYNLSDCYVFPTIDKKACIETPLSVLEAMSCNLPIITTRFGALPEVFDGTDGLFFVEDNNEIYQAIQSIKKGSIEIKTRDKVLPYSWDTIAETLKEIYTELR